jgi:hypothetical protein
MTDFYALLLADLALAGLTAGLAMAGVLVVKVDLKRPVPSQPRKRRQPKDPREDAPGDPWNPDEPPF